MCSLYDPSALVTPFVKMRVAFLTYMDFGSVTEKDVHETPSLPRHTGRLPMCFCLVEVYGAAMGGWYLARFP